MKKNITEITTNNIPGAWYGNDLGYDQDNPNRGNVVVNPELIAGAILWLIRQKASIMKTGIHNGGILIHYEK